MTVALALATRIDRLRSIEAATLAVHADDEIRLDLPPVGRTGHKTLRLATMIRASSNAGTTPLFHNSLMSNSFATAYGAPVAGS